jgi:hypothetical protein
MQERYRLYRRTNGVYYLEDVCTRKQESLKTQDRAEAKQLTAARNQAATQPALNVVMAQAYLRGKSPEMLTRTWADVLADVAQTYRGPTRDRWERFAQSRPLEIIRSIPLVHTESDHFLRVLRHPRAGTSTNIWLRRLHNYAMDLGWLLSPVLSRRAWPNVRYKQRLAVTMEEQAQIIASERNPERRAYYEMLWETGGSQSDIANLSWANVDQQQRLLIFYRMKLEGRQHEPVQLRIGSRLEALLDELPQEGFFFPRIRLEKPQHRATEFSRRCRIAQVVGKTLHSFRYAWAERACEAGMPEREAMAHLGHKSSAIHRAYARKAKIVTLPLEYYEEQRESKMIQFRKENAA